MVAVVQKREEGLHLQFLVIHISLRVATSKLCWWHCRFVDHVLNYVVVHDHSDVCNVANIDMLQLLLVQTWYLDWLC